jgi:hypothetical protein
MSAGNDHLSDKNKKGKYVDGKQNQDDKPSQAHEHGDIFFFFFYRLKIAAREVRGIHDIRRFYLWSAPPRPCSPVRKQKDGKMQAEVRMNHRVLCRG